MRRGKEEGRKTCCCFSLSLSPFSLGMQNKRTLSGKGGGGERRRFCSCSISLFLYPPPPQKRLLRHRRSPLPAPARRLRYENPSQIHHRVAAPFLLPLPPASGGAEGRSLALIRSDGATGGGGDTPAARAGGGEKEENISYRCMIFHKRLPLAGEARGGGEGGENMDYEWRRRRRKKGEEEKGERKLSLRFSFFLVQGRRAGTSECVRVAGVCVRSARTVSSSSSAASKDGFSSSSSSFSLLSRLAVM